MSFWDIMWFFLWTYVFIAYLFVLFHIISDIFRDETLNGWLKAVWIIFLVFLPVLTSIVYLIARGRSMTQRQMASVQAAREETDSYIRSVAATGGASPAEEIAKAKALLDAGTISSADFESLKRRALATV